MAVALGLQFHSGEAGAQPPAGAAASRTRIGLVNFHEVIKNYKKLDAVRVKSKEMFEEYEGKLKTRKLDYDAIQKQLADRTKVTPEAQRIELEDKANKIRFEMETITKAGQKAIMTFEQEALAGIYKDVNRIVADHAKANGVDIVFRFNEDWGDDYHKAPSVVDRLKHPMWPMYWDPSLNMTGAVKQKLDEEFTNNKAAPMPVVPK